MIMPKPKEDYFPEIKDEFAQVDPSKTVDDYNLDDFDGVDYALLQTIPDTSDQLSEESEKIERKGLYTRDWEMISLQYRESQAFTCESCQADLTDHKGLLHVHHMDENKGNNDPENLEALCIVCHNKRHGDMGKNITEAVLKIIHERRKIASNR